MTTATHLWVDRRALRTTQLGEQALTCGAGDVLLVVERFGLTANNITYAVAGDAANYWKFFPAPEPWGNVPVWGFASVAESRCEHIAVGERCYGYLPMATHLVVQPQRIAVSGFVDGAKHRSGLPAVYNQYQRVTLTDRETENAQMVLRPLFMTSFLLDDFLADNAFFDARAVILSSASSKTSLGLAFELARKRKGRIEVVGLTSPAHVAFVERLGFYDRVVTYDALETLDAGVPSVYVDMAGNGSVLGRVHAHFNDRLRHSCTVGVTHWEQALRSAPNLPGPKPTMFFAPDHIAKRSKEWGPGGLARQFDPDWSDFVVDSRRWLTVVDVRGATAMQRSYLEALEGRVPPDRGVIIAPGD